MLIANSYNFYFTSLVDKASEKVSSMTCYCVPPKTDFTSLVDETCYRQCQM